MTAELVDRAARYDGSDSCQYDGCDSVAEFHIWASVANGCMSTRACRPCLAENGIHPVAQGLVDGGEA
jgi:hypothetical protein